MAHILLWLYVVTGLSTVLFANPNDVVIESARSLGQHLELSVSHNDQIPCSDPMLVLRSSSGIPAQGDMDGQLNLFVGKFDSDDVAGTAKVCRGTISISAATLQEMGLTRGSYAVQINSRAVGRLSWNVDDSITFSTLKMEVRVSIPAPGSIDLIVATAQQQLGNNVLRLSGAPKLDTKSQAISLNVVNNDQISGRGNVTADWIGRITVSVYERSLGQSPPDGNYALIINGNLAGSLSYKEGYFSFVAASECGETIK